MSSLIPKWLEWARTLQAIAQTGLTYTTDPYDHARYREIREIAAEILAAHSQLDGSTIMSLFEEEHGHPTPKVDVRAAIFQHNAILLVKERSDGLWTLPGGWADVGESPREAVEREVREELGYDVQAVRFLALDDRDKHNHPPLAYHVYKLFFECEIVGGSAQVSEETEDIGFFSLENLPPLSLTRVTASQIARLVSLHQRPLSPSEYD